jgi:hypothetical protein
MGLTALNTYLKALTHQYQNSSEVFIYDTYGFNLIDIFHNGKLYSLQSPNIDSTDVHKIAKNNRLAHHYSEHINLSKHEFFNDLSVAYSDGLFIVNNKVFAFSETIYNSEYDLSKINYLLLNNPKHLLSDLNESSLLKIVSMPSLKGKKKKTFLLKNIFDYELYHDIRRDGFLKIKL